MNTRTRCQNGYYDVAAYYQRRALNIFFSLLLIVCAAPFFLILAIISKLRIGGPLIYKGTRLGKDKKPFTMYKFRTLSPGAAHVIGAELLTQKVASEKSLVLTGLGKFLRSTRLDELPQLFNILKGDMNFMGPRPERPEIYEKICKHINGYDRRFTVKPGLIGYSQLFTPHSTPKTIRTFIDNKFLLKKNRLLLDILIIFKTIFVILYRILKILLNYGWALCTTWRKFHALKERRTLERIYLQEAVLFLDETVDGKKKIVEIGTVNDMNEEALLVCTNRDRIPESANIKLKVNFKNLLKTKKKTKTAACSAAVYSRTELKTGPYKYGFVLKYVPRSPLDFYMVHQYFLQESIVRF
jgi:lipopolysaccharide/colanic/teichoic acid biosynthesis glycosyltransferase